MACVVGLAHSGNGTHRSTKVDRKWGRVQRTQLSDLVRRIDDHTSLLDKWKTKNSVDSDIGASCDEECGWRSVASQIWHVELEGNSQIGRDGYAVVLDDATQDDGCVISVAVNCSNTV